MKFPGATRPADDSGQPEVYIQSFPVGDQRRRVSASGGSVPEWRADGQELFYLAADGSLMAVPVSLNATPVLGAPMELFQTGLLDAGRDGRPYGVTADGQRFLMRTSGRAQSRLDVVLNWSVGLGS